jgi:hypothetical protein
VIRWSQDEQDRHDRYGTEPDTLEQEYDRLLAERDRRDERAMWEQAAQDALYPPRADSAVTKLGGSGVPACGVNHSTRTRPPGSTEHVNAPAPRQSAGGSAHKEVSL